MANKYVKNMLNIFSNKGNANQHYTEILSHQSEGQSWRNKQSSMHKVNLGCLTQAFPIPVLSAFKILLKKATRRKPSGQHKSTQVIRQLITTVRGIKSWTNKRGVGFPMGNPKNARRKSIFGTFSSELLERFIHQKQVAIEKENQKIRIPRSEILTI